MPQYILPQLISSDNQLQKQKSGPNDYPRAIRWNAELEAYFIEEVRNIRFLWDSNDPLNSKKTVKRAGYEEIVDIMRKRWPAYSVLFAGELLMKKFANLRTYFYKEFRRNKALSSVAEGKFMKSRWVHYDRMVFLLECISPEDSISSLNDSSIEDDSEIYPQIASPQTSENSKLEMELIPENLKSEMELISESSKSEMELIPRTVKSEMELIPSSSSSTVDITENIPQQKRKVPTDENSSMEEYGNFPKRFNEDYNDPDELYGKFIASQLKSINNEKHKDIARFEIHNVIMKYKYLKD